jgi:hypothetical protein
VQLVRLAGGRGEFNELEAVDAHRVFEGDAGIFNWGVHEFGPLQRLRMR